MDTGDNTLTPEVETEVPASERAIHRAFNPRGSIPTFVFGQKYYRIGNGYEREGVDGLVKEAGEFRLIIRTISELEVMPPAEIALNSLSHLTTEIDRSNKDVDVEDSYYSQESVTNTITHAHSRAGPCDPWNPDPMAGSGTSEDPYQITDCCQLQGMKNDLVGHYILMNDIDCFDTVNWNWDENNQIYSGFEPIGNGIDFPNSLFTGIFNGQNHLITDLYFY